MTPSERSKVQLVILLGGFVVVIIGAILGIRAYNSLDELDGIIAHIQ